VKKVFRDHRDPNVSYMVMPFLRPMNDPPFESVKEIIGFTDQILEVAMDSFITFNSSSDTVRAWYFSTRKGWHTGMTHYSLFCQLPDRFPEIASEGTS
jgi:hypothetical protein